MIDRDSSTWRALTSHATKKMQEARTLLEQPGLEHGPSEFERGRIAALTEILGLGKPAVAVAENADDTGYRLQT